MCGIKDHRQVNFVHWRCLVSLEFELRINNGAKVAITNACTANGLRRNYILSLIVATVIEQLANLQSHTLTVAFEAYIEMSATEREWWQTHNHQNTRDNHLTEHLTELTFYVNHRIYGRIDYWRRINDSLMRYSLNYILARIIERTVYNMLRDAEKNDVPIEFYLWEWYIRNV